MLYTQPQSGPLQVDWDNPITHDLASAFVLGQACRLDTVRRTTATAVGTKTAVTAGGLATGFGVTFGTGASVDRITTTFNGPLTERSYMFVFNRNGAGGGSLGRLFDKSSGSSGQFLYWRNSSSLMAYGFYTGTERTVSIPGSAATGATMTLLVTQSSSGTNNFVNAYLDGEQVVTNSNLTGALVDASAAVLTIGNRASDSIRSWDGLIECAYVWERVLSADEAKSLYATRYQIFVDEDDEDEILLSPQSVASPTGSLASTLSGITLASSGAVTNAGAFASTLAGATMSASGVIGSAPSGAFASTLDGMTMSANGSLLNAGSFASTLAGASMSASGNVATSATGTFASTLGGVSMYAYDAVPVAGTNASRRKIPRRFTSN